MDLLTPERLAAGYVVVLPGIDGKSWLNRGIVPGLVEAGVPFGIEFYDWTWGFWWLLKNLRDSARHEEQSRVVAGKIEAYRRGHPTQPVFVMGHSAGGAMTLLSLAKLPDDVRVTAGILLAPAISPQYDVRHALVHTERGVWNFSSWGDLVYLGALTTLCGTVDGQHGLAAGAKGFAPEVRTAASAKAFPPLHETPWERSMLRHGNRGGHFGCIGRRFVRERVGPLVLGARAGGGGESAEREALAGERRG